MHALDTISIGRPVTRGALALYPLYMHGNGTVDYVPGPVASDGGLVDVDEHGRGASVPSLTATVVGDSPVLLIEGETFVGGLQNRVLNVSVLLAPGKQELPVACVEAHRWGARREMRRADLRAPYSVRSTKNRSVAREMRVSLRRYADQRAVWDEVDRELVVNAAAAPTAALHDAFDAAFQRDDERVRAVEELARLGPLPEQQGVVVATGGRCVAAEVFDRNDTLAAYWPTIVRSTVLDLPDERQRKDRDRARVPLLGDALHFVLSVREADRTAAPGVSLGHETHFTGADIVAQALEVDGVLVHLSIVAA